MSSTTARRSRPRIAPRSGPGRTTGPNIEWDRVGRIVLVLVLVAVIASYIRPVIHLVDSWQESKAAEARLAELQSENDRLKRQATELQTPAAAIRQARELGLVGVGEQAYKVEGLK